jgi:hypothetical protein
MSRSRKLVASSADGKRPPKRAGPRADFGQDEDGLWISSGSLAMFTALRRASWLYGWEGEPEPRRPLKLVAVNGKSVPA